MITEYDEIPMLTWYQGLMKADLRRLLKQIYRLSEIITQAMITENYFDRLLKTNKMTRKRIIERALSAWSKLTTLRLRVDAPLHQADHFDLWELLDDLREYAWSTHEAFFPVIAENPYRVPLPEKMDKRVVYNATEYFDFFERLLRNDVDTLDRLLNRLLSQTACQAPRTSLKKPHNLTKMMTT
jgi:hypothetical protein